MSWEIVQLGRFLKNRDLRYKPNDPKIKGLKRIEKIDFSGNIYISEKPSNTDMILVKSGDLVISGINVEKGAMAIYQGKDDITATIHYSSYEFDPEKIDLVFLKNFLKSKKFTEALKEQVPGGIKTEIKPKHILPLEVEIPTEIEEQKAIIQKFESKKGKIESIGFEQDQQLDLLKKLRQQILQDAVQGKLVPQDPNDEPASKLLERIKAEKEKLIREKKIRKEKPLPPIKPEDIPFEIPENWKWCRLGSILIEIKYGTSKSCNYDSTQNSCVLRIPNVSSGMLDGEDLKYTNLSPKEKTELSLEKDDILIIRSNGSRELVGRTVLVSERFVGFTYAGYLVRLRFDKELSDARYLLNCSSSSFFRELIETPLRTTVGINNINSTEISELLIPLPPLNEQQRIVTKIEHLMKLCVELEQTIQQNQKYTQDLLQMALKEALEPKPN